MKLLDFSEGMAKVENIRHLRKCQSYTNPQFWLAVNWLRYLKIDR